MLKPGSTQIETLSENSSYPVVVSSSDANSSAYVLWEKRGDLRAIRLLDN